VSYVRSFLVTTDDSGESTFTVRVADGVPRIGDAYAGAGGEVDGTAFAVRILVRAYGDWPYTWVVTVEYSSRWQPEEEDPLDRPAEIDWDSATVARPIEADRTGARIANSAGDLFEPPVETERTRLGLTITRNEPEFDTDTALDYVGAVNSDEWFGQEEGTVRCRRISGRRQWERGQEFYRVSYSFEIDPQGWTYSPMDRGKHKLVGGARVPITRGGQPVTEPVLLDGIGGELGAGLPPEFQGPYEIYETQPFADLNLP
jgi:hypothetical protein